MRKWIAKRDLLFSLKGSDIRSNLAIEIGVPYLLKEGSVNFEFAEGTAGCTVEVIGLEDSWAFEESSVHEVYGADLLQALQIAVDVEPMLKRLSKQYDIYFLDGESYFDPNDSD